MENGLNAQSLELANYEFNNNLKLSVAAKIALVNIREIYNLGKAKGYLYSCLIFLSFKNIYIANTLFKVDKVLNEHILE